MVGILQDVLPQNYNKVADFTQLGATPFAENSLNLLHAPSGAGKSYNTVAMLGRDEAVSAPIIYLDFDGNQGSFTRYCHNYNVEIVAMNNIWDALSNEDKLGKILKELSEGTIVILDSYAAIFENVNINDASSASKPLYDLTKIAMKGKLTLIIIDHSTEQWGKDNNGKPKLVGFKIEGSKSGKFKPCSTVSKFIPADSDEPAKGGSFIIEKSRVETITKKSKFTVIADSTVGEKIQATIAEVEKEQDEDGWIDFSRLRDKTNDKLRDRLNDFEGRLFVTKMGGERGTKKMFSIRPERLVEYLSQSNKNLEKVPKIGGQYSTTATRPYISNKSIGRIEEENKKTLLAEEVQKSPSIINKWLAEAQSPNTNVDTAVIAQAKTVGDQYREKMNAYKEGSNWAEWINIQPLYPLSLSTVMHIEGNIPHEKREDMTPEVEANLWRYFDEQPIIPKHVNTICHTHDSRICDCI